MSGLVQLDMTVFANGEKVCEQACAMFDGDWTTFVERKDTTVTARPNGKLIAVAANTTPEGQTTVLMYAER